MIKWVGIEIFAHKLKCETHARQLTWLLRQGKNINEYMHGRGIYIGKPANVIPITQEWLREATKPIMANGRCFTVVLVID